MDPILFGTGLVALAGIILGGIGFWQKHKLEKKEEEERLREQSLDENGSRPKSVPG